MDTYVYYLEKHAWNFHMAESQGHDNKLPALYWLDLAIQEVNIFHYMNSHFKWVDRINTSHWVDCTLLFQTDYLFRIPTMPKWELSG